MVTSGWIFHAQKIIPSPKITAEREQKSEREEWERTKKKEHRSFTWITGATIAHIKFMCPCDSGLSCSPCSSSRPAIRLTLVIVNGNKQNRAAHRGKGRRKTLVCPFVGDRERKNKDFAESKRIYFWNVFTFAYWSSKEGWGGGGRGEEGEREMLVARKRNFERREAKTSCLLLFEEKIREIKKIV